MINVIRIQPKLKHGATAPRSFDGYEVFVNKEAMPSAITFERKA